MSKDKYLELLLESGVLRFGEFKTKSGRLSPYFFNAGNFDTGERLGAIAAIYAQVIEERFGSRVDNLFGPAYKGIPLAVMSAFQLSGRLGRDVSFTFNRKEAKGHGEGGWMVGRAYQGGEKVVVVEDVITGGTSFAETLPLVKRAGADVIGIVVGVDRQERGSTGTKAALKEVSENWGIPAYAVITVSEIVQRLHNQEVAGRVWIDDHMRRQIQNYMAMYGADDVNV